MTSRQQHGFSRTQCACALCTVPCRHLPGSLDVADLATLCPADQDIFAWAEQHLRAIIDKPFPTLVPGRQANGHCHWLFEGRCLVHEHAPYSCAFFDAHMSDDEIARRSAATIQARRDDAAANGLYFRVWSYLSRRGLVVESGNREALAAEIRSLMPVLTYRPR